MKKKKMSSKSKMGIMLGAIAVLAIGGGAYYLSIPDEKQKFSDEYVNLVKSINVDYQKYSTEYGAKAVSSKKQKINTIDCVVFNRATDVKPQSVGEAIAWFESMEIRTKIGCGESLEALTTYESARRSLRDIWIREVEKIPYSERTLITNSSSGKKIVEKTQRVTNESMACESINGSSQRKDGVSRSIEIQEERCRAQKYPKFEDACKESWTVAMSLQSANGNKDDRAWMSELASRYRMLSYICYPAAAMEYSQFHAVLPKTLFSQKAYRLAIPIDPLSACTYKKIQEKRQKAGKYTADYNRYHRQCAKEFSLSNLYSTNDQIPYRFNLNTLFEPNSWFYDPTSASSNPTRWTLGDCERETVAKLQASKINIPSPEALKSFCKNKDKKEFILPNAPVSDYEE